MASNWTPRGPAAGSPWTPRTSEPVPQRELFPHAVVRGWVDVSDGGARSNMVVRRLSCLIRSSVLAETCGSRQPKVSDDGGTDRLWLTVSNGLLFLSLDEIWDPVPVAFMMLSHLECANVDRGASTLTLESKLGSDDTGGGAQLAVLLSDGRFQVLGMGTLKLMPHADFDLWVTTFSNSRLYF